jgi:hypothetical protein
MENVRLDLRGRGWSSMDWVHLAQDRDQKKALWNKVINVRFEVSTAVTMMIIIFWEMTIIIKVINLRVL